MIGDGAQRSHCLGGEGRMSVDLAQVSGGPCPSVFEVWVSTIGEALRILLRARH